MKLRSRLFLSHVAVAAAGAILTAGGALVSFHAYVVASNRADLAARTEAIAANVADWLQAGDLAHVRLITARYGAQEDVWIRVLSVQGALLASSSPGEDAAIGAWNHVAGVTAALQGRPQEGLAPGVGSHDDRLYDARPLVRGGHLLGVLRVSRTLAALRRQDWRAAGMVLSSLLLVLGAGALTSFILSRALARPIARMRDFAVEIGAGRLGGAVAGTGDDEIAELATALNSMSARLADVEKERRTFLARASHELRTPVTNVQASLQALADGAAEEKPLRERFLATALHETRRMAGLVRELLELGQLEAGIVMERRTVDLKRALEMAVQALSARFERAGVALSMHAENGLHVEGDPDRLQQVLINIFDNALRFSPAGSMVTASLRASGTEAVVGVSDQGPGFRPADLPRLFQQFYTGETPRTGNGSGLGLAIARRIVDVHRGTISAANGPKGGATLTLRLPLIGPQRGEPAAGAELTQATS